MGTQRRRHGTHIRHNNRPKQPDHNNNSLPIKANNNHFSLFFKIIQLLKHLYEKALLRSHPIIGSIQAKLDTEEFLKQQLKVGKNGKKTI
jgi:hypothetical protein